MKSKARIIIVIFSIFVLSLIASVVYLFVTDIESMPTEEIRQMCNVREEKYKGRKVFIITSKDAVNSSKYILYFHGGSYMAGVSDEHWGFLQDLAIDTNATIIVPDYPLTPKYDYKDVFGMIEPLYREILEKIDSKNLILMGDSAGGGMALALCEKIGEEKIVQPSKTILISPWLDVRLENPKISEVEENDKQLNKEALQIAGIAYMGNNENSYLVNPVDGPLENLGKIIIYTGTYDILNPDVHILEERVQKLNEELTSSAGATKNIEENNNDEENKSTEGTSKNDGNENNSKNLIQLDIREYDKMPHIWILDRENKDNLDNGKAYENLINEVVEREGANAGK